MLLQDNLHSSFFVLDRVQKTLDLFHLSGDLRVIINSVRIQKLLLLLALFFNFSQAGLLAIFDLIL